MVAKILVEKNNNFKGLLSEWGLSTRPCDICHTTSALLYCRTDATFLCGACDVKVHMAGHHGVMMAHHERVWMCEVCEQAPAAVTCKADAAMLCTSCDHDIHSANPLASRHERVPVVPFFDSAVHAATCSTTTAVNSAFLSAVDTAVKNDGDGGDGDAQAWLIPNLNSTFLYNDSYLVDCAGQNFEKISQQLNQQQSYESLSLAISDTVVPTQIKGNLKFSNKSNHLFDTSCEIDFTQPAKHNNNNKNNQQHILSSFNFSAHQRSVSSSEIGVVPEGNTNSPSEVTQTFCNSVAGGGVTTAARGDPAPALDREARVLRYREKRKNRKFEKTIRYTSRKAYAEKRPRIKGRFAKRAGKNETSDVNQISGSDFGTGSGSSYMLNQEYGVVPTF
ncbi:hypothetical protein RND81_07G082500 [Saponaria officinalis]|uniref:Uncharacterized protein n=1 Tax=Saponaria officinalis TaxID=3572 RepID=A0AAW1JPL8_SAPOF